jgi:predicted nucleic acid-binding protein
LNIVFDTNVWLDVLVFDNTLVSTLLKALQASDAKLAMCAATQNELLHQLNRLAAAPQLSAARQQRAFAASSYVSSDWSASQNSSQNSALVDAQFQDIYPYTHICTIEIPLINEGYKEYTNNSIRLPKCKDKDDQVFISLASVSQATLLITHDKALLKCRRYALSGSAAYGLIYTPAQALQWLQAYI